MKNRYRWIQLFIAASVVLMVMVGCGPEPAVPEQKSIVEIEGDSMEPTLYDGAKFIMLGDDETIQNITYGDIIAFRYPEKPDSGIIYVKRVVGLAGDQIEIRSRVVYVNGLAENFGGLNNLDYGPYTVEDNAYFVLGDNGRNSEDSRYFENPSVSIELVLGKMIEIVDDGKVE